MQLSFGLLVVILYVIPILKLYKNENRNKIVQRWMKYFIVTSFYLFFIILIGNVFPQIQSAIITVSLLLSPFFILSNGAVFSLFFDKVIYETCKQNSDKVDQLNDFLLKLPMLIISEGLELYSKLW